MSEAERKKTLNSVKALLDYAITHMEKGDEGQREKKKIAEHWKEYAFDPISKTYDAHFQLKLTIPFDVDDLAKLPPTSTTSTAPAPTVIHVKEKSEPIIWLGRGYMGDANNYKK